MENKLKPTIDKHYEGSIGQLECKGMVDEGKVSSTPNPTRFPQSTP